MDVSRLHLEDRRADFTVAEKYQIDWLRNEPQSHGLFENWVQLSQRYVDMLRDHPVPVDLKVIARVIENGVVAVSAVTPLLPGLAGLRGLVGSLYSR